MASTPDPRGLTGLARSLQELFDRTAPPSSQPERPPPGMEDGGPPPADPAESARALEDWLDAVLSPGSTAWEAPPASFRRAAAALAEAGRLEPVAEAILRLAAVSPDESHHADALAFARGLMSPAVAGRLAARLGAVRDQARRAELTAAVGRLGPPMAEALADALTRAGSRAARHAYTDGLVALGREGADAVEALV
ncbi:MAG TPA: hypothetical protein VE173_03750, partial [Longimicrobiales bacterium]|nr:hypothetical protein [Longimicrobiales bacterium]